MEQPMVIDSSRGGYPWLTSVSHMSFTQVNKGDPFKDEYIVDFGKVKVTATYQEWLAIAAQLQSLFLGVIPKNIVDRRG